MCIPDAQAHPHTTRRLSFALLYHRCLRGGFSLHTLLMFVAARCRITFNLSLAGCSSVNTFVSPSTPGCNVHSTTTRNLLTCAHPNSGCCKLARSSGCPKPLRRSPPG